MIIGRGELLGMLNLTGKVNSSLPILDSVLLRQDRSKLSFAWTDLVTSIQVTQDVKADGGLELNLAVPTKTLKNSLELMGDSGVILELCEEGLVVSDRYTKSIIKSHFEAGDFPTMPSQIGHKEKEIEIELAPFLEGLKKVLFAVSQDWGKKSICGIQVEFFKNRVELTATDGRQLANWTIAGEFSKAKFTLPTAAVVVLLKLKGNIVKIRVKKQLVQFEVGEVLETVLAIEHTFPSWKEVMPERKGYHKSVLDKKEVTKALKIASKIDSISTLTFGRELTIETDNPDTKIIQSIPSSGNRTVTKVKLNNKYLSEGIRAIEGDEIEIRVKDGENSIMLREERYTYLLMPVKVE